MKATKAELRREIAELRSVGARMANMCFNWAQHEGYRMTVDCQLMDQMRREWDAIKRAEVKP